MAGELPRTSIIKTYLEGGTKASAATAIAMKAKPVFMLL